MSIRRGSGTTRSSNNGFARTLIPGIQDLIAEAERLRIPVTLQVLKVNPALRLYERLWFRVTGDTESHHQMRRPTEPT